MVYIYLLYVPLHPCNRRGPGKLFTQVIGAVPGGAETDSGLKPFKGYHLESGVGVERREVLE